MAKTYSSAEILNTYTQSVQASTAWGAAIPLLAENDDVAGVFNIIFNNPGLSNEFYAGLTNLVIPALISNEIYNNHFSYLKQGSMNGMTQESISVDTKNPMVFDPNASASVAYGDYTPDYTVQYHTMNVKLTFPASVNRAAYLGYIEKGDIAPFVSDILDQVVTKANYTEEQIFKQVIAQKMVNGQIAHVEGVGSGATIRQSAASIKALTTKFEYRNTKYNLLNVPTFTKPEDLVIITSADFDAAMDVDVLAQAFHMDRATFLGRQIVIDSFGAIDTALVSSIFSGVDGSYIELNASQLAALDDVYAIVCDRRYFFYKEAYTEMAEQPNAASLKRNYFYHRFLYLGTEDARNAAMFESGTPAVSAVTVDPSTATLATKGAKVHLGATVTAANFAPKSVIWSTADSTKAVVDAYGNVERVLATGSDSTTVVITATSTFDSTKKGTCTITLS